MELLLVLWLLDTSGSVVVLIVWLVSSSDPGGLWGIQGGRVNPNSLPEAWVESPLQHCEVTEHYMLYVRTMDIRIHTLDSRKLITRFRYKLDVDSLSVSDKDLLTVFEIPWKS